MGRPGRRKMVDRVIRYKYPSKIGTNYQKEHAHFNSAKAAGKEVKGSNFNVEKEHKIINPHNVEKLTINRIDYQPFTIQPREPKKLKAPSPQKTAPMKSSYQNEFQNWGPNEVIHEKDPKYPYYSLPFRGTSQYAQTFCGASDVGNSGRGLPFGEEAVRSQYGGSGINFGPHGQSVGYGGSQFGGSGVGGPGYHAQNAHMASSTTNLRPLLAATGAGNAARNVDGMAAHHAAPQNHNLGRVHARYAAQKDAVAAMGLLKIVGTGLNGQTAGDLRHRCEQRQAATVIGYGLIRDRSAA